MRAKQWRDRNRENYYPLENRCPLCTGQGMGERALEHVHGWALVVLALGVLGVRAVRQVAR